MDTLEKKQEPKKVTKLNYGYKKKPTNQLKTISERSFVQFYVLEFNSIVRSCWFDILSRDLYYNNYFLSGKIWLNLKHGWNKKIYFLNQ